MPKAHKNGSPSTRSSQIPDNTEASSTHAARQPCRETSEPDIAEKLRNIDWYQFEKLVEIIYRNRGLSVLRLGGANLEGGVDLIAASPTEKFVVQCRHWRNRTLGVRQIRDFLGILADCKIDKGILVTLGDCTDEASQLARKHGIQILNETELTAMLVESGLINDEKVVNLFDDKNKYCPKCERPLVLRTASIKGTQIWGCSYFPSCTFSMKLES